MSKSTSTALLIAFLAVMTPLTAVAGPSSTDWSLGPGGVYSYAGGTASLIGDNIPVLNVFGDLTPTHNGASLNVVGGLLDFTSGTGTPGAWSWSGGGTLKLTGCIAGVTTKPLVSCNGSNNVVLIDDDFTSVSIVNQAGIIDAVFGNVTGNLNPSVAAYFGVPTAFTTGTFSTAIAALGAPGSKIIGTNILGVLKADPPGGVPMPENWGIGESVAFFGIVMLVFAAMVRKGAVKWELVQSPRKS